MSISIGRTSMIIAVLSLLLFSFAAAAAPIQVGITQIVEHPALDAARKGSSIDWLSWGTRMVWTSCTTCKAPREIRPPRAPSPQVFRGRSRSGAGHRDAHGASRRPFN